MIEGRPSKAIGSSVENGGCDWMCPKNYGGASSNVCVLTKMIPFIYFKKPCLIDPPMFSGNFGGSVILRHLPCWELGRSGQTQGPGTMFRNRIGGCKDIFKEIHRNTMFP